MRKPEALGEVLATIRAGSFQDLPKHPRAGFAKPCEPIRVEQVAHHDEAIAVEDLRRTSSLGWVADLETRDAVVRPKVLPQCLDAGVVRRAAGGGARIGHAEAAVVREGVAVVSTVSLLGVRSSQPTDVSP